MLGYVLEYVLGYVLGSVLGYVLGYVLGHVLGSVLGYVSIMLWSTRCLPFSRTKACFCYWGALGFECCIDMFL